MTTNKKFAPGFRLSFLDVLVLGLAGITAVFLKGNFFQLSVIILFVIGHFFLFCNVLRMSRKPELIWALVFVLLNLSNIYFTKPAFFMVLVLSIVATIILTGFEMRKKSYHGMGWKKINPELKSWWENKIRK